MVNFVSIAITTIGVFIFGMLWYSSAFFGKTWKKYVRTKDPSGAAFLAELIITFVMVWIAAWFVTRLAQPIFVAGAVVGGMIWLGFVMPATLSEILWTKRNVKVWVINNGYRLISLVIASGILAVW